MKFWYWREEDKSLWYADSKEKPRDSKKILKRPSEDHIYNGKKWVIDKDLYLEERKKEYPSIEDQLEAILKQLNYMQMNGQTDLISEMDGIIGQWLAVKKKFPKPKGK